MIDGKICYMAPPSRTHQQLLLSLSRKIADYIDSKNGDCEVNIAPFAVFFNEDDTNYLEPDISITCDSSKLDDKECQGAPTAGVREDWIVDPTS